MSTLTLKLVNEVMNEINKEEAEEIAVSNNLIELAKARFECLRDVLQTILDRGNWRLYGPKYVKIPLHIVYELRFDYGRPQLKICLCTKQNPGEDKNNLYGHYFSWEIFEEIELANDEKFEVKAKHIIRSHIESFRGKIKELEKNENVVIQ